MIKWTKKLLAKISGQRGGVDLIQFLVALIIIGTAAVTATFSIYIARGNLDSEWRKKRALEIARDEVEYWSAFIFEGQGGIAVPPSIATRSIARTDTIGFEHGDQSEPIMCEVVREPLELNQILLATQDIESYKIKVYVTWQEIPDNSNLTFAQDTVRLESWMVHDISK